MATFADIQLEISNLMSIPYEDMDDEQRQAWLDYAEQLGTQEAQKVDNYAQAKRFGLARADAKEAEARRLMASARAERNNWARTDEYMMHNMKANGLRSVKGNVYSMSLAKRSVVRIDDEALIPAEFWKEKVERAVSKTEIKAAIKAGKLVPGASMGENEYLLVR